MVRWLAYGSGSIGEAQRIFMVMNEELATFSQDYRYPKLAKYYEPFSQDAELVQDTQNGSLMYNAFTR